MGSNGSIVVFALVVVGAWVWGIFTIMALVDGSVGELAVSAAIFVAAQLVGKFVRRRRMAEIQSEIDGMEQRKWYEPFRP